MKYLDKMSRQGMFMNGGTFSLLRVEDNNIEGKDFIKRFIKENSSMLFPAELGN